MSVGYVGGKAKEARGYISLGNMEMARLEFDMNVISTYKCLQLSCGARAQRG